MVTLRTWACSVCPGCSRIVETSRRVRRALCLPAHIQHHLDERPLGLAVSRNVAGRRQCPNAPSRTMPATPTSRAAAQARRIARRTLEPRHVRWRMLRHRLRQS